MYYGKVLDTLAQHHPEYTALAWGAIKILLMGVIERATLVQELAKAFIAIGDVLPRAKLSAELYQTNYMRDALSRLYAYIIRFLHLCVRWYSRSSLGRFFSGLKNPFELHYQDLVEQIKTRSADVQDLANAGARVDIRDILTIQALKHDQALKRYERIEDCLNQILQTSTSHKALSEFMSVDIGEIKRNTWELKFDHVLRFLAPEQSPEKALLKSQSFIRRDPTQDMPSRDDAKVKKILQTWAFTDHSSLLVVRIGFDAKKRARELVAEVIQTLSGNGQRIFWNLSLPRSSDRATLMSDVFKSLVHQALRYTPGLFAKFAEQLNLEKIQSSHTDSEWIDLICLLFQQIPDAFIVIESRDIYKSHRHDPEWAEHLLKLLQRAVEKSENVGNRLRVLFVVYRNALKSPIATSIDGKLLVTSLQTPTSPPPRMRHMARRTNFNTKIWKLQKPKF
ncbi:hypothetical protein PtrSN002B_010849 [Pyrenophora tritici-repentis]|uniref:DUF7708 domain-containing protein n=2 Tax=Pyrenophora tritici-repentis TaxID=45151 RepID=A0A2W1DBH3_9PLEO|nr:uncharacterized protein PTRG_08676 [Pyrenophora tritici-repentis Pt-1C-BFP]KAA8615373.1 hypothetical protein PtrV1_10769 [Pyrenophora tritici-repentis]EDU51595.1 conserved hypothetical protein [Pyrenophora tritici-repentis Pt-1C-BFP]KAF7444052.1 hypothetical protein A1F99_121260 [Pyrenophora tritici-repentis]KAF7566212.1 hypothetical protein PtrM4_145320 [Pyrenophora tritici-repentis]KAG9379791.1 hypothetical protein A1F94_010147 [Pyrenophora tritici-repentis]